MKGTTSDRTTLLEMLNRAGIPFEERGDDVVPCVVVEQGYSGFMTIFTFDADGQLNDMGAYE